MKKLANIHPGEILDEEFLKPLLITPYRLAKDIGIPQTRVSQILKHNRRILPIQPCGLAVILVTPQNSGLACKMILILKNNNL